MAASNVWAVQGFLVKKVVVQKDKVELVLTADKDDISAQNGNIGDILASLEAHSSGEYPVEITLGRCDAGSSD